MNTIEIENAFSRLGVPREASEVEVKRAYKKLVKKYHPDPPYRKGNEEILKEVNKAYEIAKSVFNDSNELILIETPNSLERVNTAARIQLVHNEIVQSLKKIEKKDLSKTKRLRDLSTTVSMVFGILTLIKIAVLPLLKDYDVSAYSFLNPILAIVTLLTGIIAYNFSRKVTKMQNSIDDFMDEIANQIECAHQLARLLRFRDIKVFSEEVIQEYIKEEDSVGKKLKSRISLPESLSMREKSHLLLLKAIEHGLIEKIGDELILPNSFQSYKLSTNYQPSKFK